MMLEIQQVGPEALYRYAQVSIGFEVRSILQVDVLEHGLSGVRLEETPVSTPYWKDYDEDERPTDWPGQFNLQNWAFFLVEDSGGQPGQPPAAPAPAAPAPAAAAAVAWNTPGVFMLEGRSDLAVLWDIRVNPACRGQGAGRMLFRAAEDWARQHGCTQLKVETQNTNLPACRFYIHMGCTLGGLQRFAYPEPYRHETMLLWYKDLRQPAR
jgi:ribosomal protein S18 acetylase RimI-like enzyme